jgi:hypothetical protein
MEPVTRTRRQWLHAASAWASCALLRAARKEFWETKDPATWSDEEKQILLGQSPWAQDGTLRMSVSTGPRAPSSYPMPSTTNPTAVKSVPIGEKPPPVPSADLDRPLEFPVLARWESAKPVRLAGGPETPELTGQFYAIRLRGLPLMPPPKAKPGETPPDPNAGMLQAMQAGTWLDRKGKPAIPCDHLFAGSGNLWNEVLLYFPRGIAPITAADKQVTLESRFAQYQLSVKFPLKEMMYRGELAL